MFVTGGRRYKNEYGVMIKYLGVTIRFSSTAPDEIPQPNIGEAFSLNKRCFRKRQKFISDEVFILILLKELFQSKVQSTYINVLKNRVNVRQSTYSLMLDSLYT